MRGGAPPKASRCYFSAVASAIKARCRDFVANLEASHFPASCRALSPPFPPPEPALLTARMREVSLLSTWSAPHDSLLP